MRGTAPRCRRPKISPSASYLGGTTLLHFAERRAPRHSFPMRAAEEGTSKTGLQKRLQYRASLNAARPTETMASSVATQRTDRNWQASYDATQPTKMVASYVAQQPTDELLAAACLSKRTSQLEQAKSSKTKCTLLTHAQLTRSRVALDITSRWSHSGSFGPRLYPSSSCITVSSGVQGSSRSRSNGGSSCGNIMHKHPHHPEATSH